MSNKLFQQNLDDKKGPQPGGELNRPRLCGQHKKSP